MQESRVLPQNKAPHLPVFPLVPLKQRKGLQFTGDRSTSPPPTFMLLMPNLQWDYFVKSLLETQGLQ